jgi:hypothetical protein
MKRAPGDREKGPSVIITSQNINDGRNAAVAVGIFKQDLTLMNKMSFDMPHKKRIDTLYEILDMNPEYIEDAEIVMRGRMGLTAWAEKWLDTRSISLFSGPMQDMKLGDIKSLSNPILQSFFHSDEFDRPRLAMALKYAPEDVRNEVFGNMSKAAAEDMRKIDVSKYTKDECDAMMEKLGVVLTGVVNEYIREKHPKKH